MAKIKYDFDPFEIAGISKKEVKKEDRDALFEDVSEFVKQSVLEMVSNQTSPVKGYGKFAKLSKDYSKIKQEEVGNKNPNLENTGSLLDSLEVQVVRGKLRLTVSNEEMDKAEGLNTGFKGHPHIKSGPVRRFIPMNGEELKQSITKEIKKIVEDYVQDND